MTDDTRGSDEIDVLRWYIYAMVVMTAALAGLYFFMRSRAEDAMRRVERGHEQLVDHAAAKVEILSMMKVYTTNKEDEARDSPLSWFANLWRKRGIPDASMKPGKWDETPRRDPDGYEEENISHGFQASNPLTREQIMAFCHEVERASTRLRCIELNISRAGKKDDMESDAWSGKVTIGYRIPILKE